ncbi:MAG: hypothetical protein AAF366_06005 [Pseudomonadota bacterium]
MTQALPPIETGPVQPDIGALPAPETFLASAGSALPATGVVEAAQGVAVTFDAAASVGALNSDGDAVVLRNGYGLSGSVDKGRSAIPGGRSVLGQTDANVSVGLSGGLTDGIQLTQQGDGPDATYKLSVADGGSLLATKSWGVTGAGETLGGSLGLQGGGSGTVTTEMTFDSKAAAIRALNIAAQQKSGEAVAQPAVDLQARADTATGPEAADLQSRADMAADAIAGAQGLVLAPASGETKAGALSRQMQELLGPSPDDAAFLADNLTGFSQRLSGEFGARIAGELKKQGLGGSATLDADIDITRTVQLPTATTDGSVSYSGQVESGLITSEAVKVGEELFGIELGGNLSVSQSLLGSVESLTATYDIPAGTRLFGIRGNKLPEANILKSEGLRGVLPDTVSYERKLTVPTELTGADRLDIKEDSLDVEVKEPANSIAGLIGKVSRGDLSDLGDKFGEQVDISRTIKTVERSGGAAGLSFSVGDPLPASISGSVSFERGNDDVTSQQTEPLFKGSGTPGGGLSIGDAAKGFAGLIGLAGQQALAQTKQFAEDAVDAVQGNGAVRSLMEAAGAASEAFREAIADGDSVWDATIAGGFAAGRDAFTDVIESAEAIEAGVGLPNNATPNPQSVIDAGGTQTQKDSYGDALKHIYSAALFSYGRNGGGSVPFFLQGKEAIAQDGWRGSPQSTMDFHNNEIGFQIGRQAREMGLQGDEARDFIVAEVAAAIDRGMSNTEIVYSLPEDTPFWLNNHGYASADQAAPGWEGRFAAIAEETWPFDD